MQSTVTNYIVSATHSSSKAGRVSSDDGEIINVCINSHRTTIYGIDAFIAASAHISSGKYSIAATIERN